MPDLEYWVAHRRYYLFGEIDHETVLPAVEVLVRCCEANPSAPFHLYLNTGGGSVADAMALCDTIREQPYTVTGIALGEVASAGLFLLGACDVRAATPSTWFLWHSIYWSEHEGETPTEMARDARHMQNYDKMLRGLLDEWTGRKGFCAGLGERKWFGVKEAKKMGLLTV